MRPVQTRKESRACGQSMSSVRRSSHSGAEFEAGSLAARNGAQPAGQDSVNDRREDESSPRTGLDQGVPQIAKRKPAVTLPARMGPAWATVKVVGKEYDQNPQVVCLDCDASFCGGVSRITEHILKKCTCSTSTLQTLADLAV